MNRRGKGAIGVLFGAAAVIAATHPAALVEGLAEPLSHLERAQHEFLDRRGHFSADLSALGLAHLESHGVRIEVWVGRGEWTARLARGWMVHPCTFTGSAGPRDGGGAGHASGCVFTPDPTRKVALPGF